MQIVMGKPVYPFYPINSVERSL